VRLLLHVLGIDDASGRWYLFWSGIGSDLAYLSVPAVLLHHLNCHEPGCWRPARHNMGGRCRKHRKDPDGAR
jgi:hypothetical protein